MANYYKLIFNILSSNVNATKEFAGFVTYTFEAVNLTIGLDRKIFDAYEIKNLKEIQPTEIFDFKQFSSIAEQDFFVDSDGVVLDLVVIEKN